MDLARKHLSRRHFLAGAATMLGASGGSFGADFLRPQAALGEPTPSTPAALSSVKHVAWMWNFSADGSPEGIRNVLAANNLGVAVKTHDGVEWMAKYDKSPHAIGGPSQVEALSRYFEDAGLPFHTWSLVKGRNPVQEARMAAAVLDAGARSVMIDLEPHSL